MVGGRRLGRLHAGEIVDPVTWAYIAIAVYGAVKSAPAAPAYSSNKVKSQFNNSGWTVSTGDASATGSGAISTTTILMICGGALLAIKAAKKK